MLWSAHYEPHGMTSVMDSKTSGCPQPVPPARCHLSGAIAIIRAPQVTLFGHRDGSGIPAVSITGPDWFRLRVSNSSADVSLNAEIRDPRRTVRRAAWISAFGIGGSLHPRSLWRCSPCSPLNASASSRTRASRASRRRPLRCGMAGRAPRRHDRAGHHGPVRRMDGGSSRLAFAIGLDRYLPAPFARLHPRWGTPYIALLSQGIACTAFVIFLQAGETWPHRLSTARGYVRRDVFHPVPVPVCDGLETRPAGRRRGGNVSHRSGDRLFVCAA